MKKILLITLTIALILGCTNENKEYLDKISLLEDELKSCRNEINTRHYQDSITATKEIARKKQELVEAKKRKEDSERKKKQEIAETEKRNKKSKTVQESEWHTDVNKAVNISVQTGKPLFFFFTGSDWCGWCKRLVKEVFVKPEFATWAAKNVVLVELDFPRRTPISEDLKKQNRELGQMFGVRGYPTGWFVTPEVTDGKVNLKKIGDRPQGYVAGGPTAWISGANKILKNK